jgi:hypothetical protein
MIGSEIRKRWVEGQKDYVEAVRHLETIERTQLDLPDAGQFPETPEEYWKAVTRKEVARAQRKQAAQDNLQIIRTTSEADFDRRCKKLFEAEERELAKQKAGGGTWRDKG